METHPAGPSSILHWRREGVTAPSEHGAGAYSFWASQEALVVKNLPAIARDIRDAGCIPGSGRSAGGGNGNPLLYSCLENPRNRRAWRATGHGVAKNQT